MSEENKDESKKQILLTGVKPTGRPHIGNYLGAMKSLVEMQYKFLTYAMVADYHALTTTHDPSELRQDSYDIVLDYLAVGLDPKEIVIFRQSDISEHTELAW